jgi:PPK2 family polyphosphate:nucleotide phosphotransferase
VAKNGGKDAKRGETTRDLKRKALEKAAKDAAKKSRSKPGGKKAPDSKRPGQRPAEDAVVEPAQAKAVRTKAARIVEQVAADVVAAEVERMAGADQPSYHQKIGELLIAPAAPLDPDAIDTAATPGVQSREVAEAEIPRLAARLSELQERLFAASRGGDSKRRVLLVLQGMDTSGKGGTVRHVVGQLDPNGLRLTAFKAPDREELAHDFLWRIRKALPPAGDIGIMDRSHYEDVLIARVRGLATPAVLGRRYGQINRFEKSLVDSGCVVVKCFLHISPQEQKKRLLARLDTPDKHWKYNPTDVNERLLWPDYQDAYRLALEKCSTAAAPWYIVPADRKWYRNYAITRLLIEALERIDPQYPPGKFDLEHERERVLES